MSSPVTTSLYISNPDIQNTSTGTVGYNYTSIQTGMSTSIANVFPNACSLQGTNMNLVASSGAIQFGPNNVYIGGYANSQSIPNYPYITPAKGYITLQLSDNYLAGMVNIVIGTLNPNQNALQTGSFYFGVAGGVLNASPIQTYTGSGGPRNSVDYVCTSGYNHLSASDVYVIGNTVVLYWGELADNSSYYSNANLFITVTQLA